MIHNIALARPTYQEFLESKVVLAPERGLEVPRDSLNPNMKPHAGDLAHWAIRGGNRAVFAAFGLQKTSIQLQILKSIIEHEGGLGLIVCPLGVKHEFVLEDRVRGFNVGPVYVRTNAELAELVALGHRYFLTNYERVRDGDLDPNLFTVVSLDESSVLRSFGSKTYQTFLTLFDKVRFKYVCTATPDPNRTKELIHYAGFLGVMDTGQALTRFFKRDSTQAGNLQLHPHKEAEFWLWVNSWAAFVEKPSDLGHDDSGYDLPPLEVHCHRLPVDHSSAGFDNHGQGKLVRDAALGVRDAAREKRDSLADRIERAKSIIAAAPDRNWIIWHDLEPERHAIEQAFPEAVTIYGTQDLDKREQAIADFAEGKIKILGTKPILSGSGCNLQRHCYSAIYLGIGYKFNDWIQSVHRTFRFGQTRPVDIHLIYTESEDSVYEVLMSKRERHKHRAGIMSEIVRKYGLSSLALGSEMRRSIGIERKEERGELFTAVNNDNVLELEKMADNSVDFIASSWPFSDHYEYCESFNDFGHNDGDAGFFAQMEYLTPHTMRVLKPGRMYCVHAKDRVLFGSVTGLGMYSFNRFSDKCADHMEKHGFIFCGRITIVTDVVRENNQTYRLGWSENEKDGTKMGVGSSEYVLLFRKLPTDRSNSYADERVRNEKPLCQSDEGPVSFDEDLPIIPGTGFSRSRWQFDAHGFWRSAGDRFLRPEEIRQLPLSQLRRVWHRFNESHRYDFKEHVQIAEHLEAAGKLPGDYMLLDPRSHHPNVWDDVVRMRTLNCDQAQGNREQHVCLARDSRVLTQDRGYVPIQEVIQGEYVLTHLGRWRRVLAVRMTGIKRVVTVKAHGVAGITLTPDHKLWTRTSDWVRERDGAERAVPGWIEAKDSLRSYLNLKLPETQQRDGDATLWWTVGRWLADGHIDKRRCAIISCGKGKWAEFSQKIGRFGGNKPHIGTAMQLQLRDPGRELRAVLSRCGTGARGKHLPPEAFTLETEKARALLDGYLSGDGYFLKSRKRWMATSVSRDLLLGLALVVQRVHGAIASVFDGREERQDIIEGRTVHAHPDWIMSFDLPGRRNKPFILKDGAWKKVRTIEQAGEAETWNLRVEEDESYTAEGCIVKNCPLQFDIVERLIERYSNPGDLVMDPFGGLGTVGYCAIQMRRRAYMIELNTDYWKDSLRYLKAAEQKINTPTLFDLLSAEDEATA